MKKNGSRVPVLFLTFLILFSGCEANRVEETESIALMDADVVLADMDAFTFQYIQNHVNLFYWQDAEFFNDQMNALKKKAGTLDVDTLALELQKIIASMEDAHSSVSLSAVLEKSDFPIEVKILEDRLYVSNIRAGYTTLHPCLFGEIIAVNGVPAGEIIRQVNPLIAGERYTAYRKAAFPSFFKPKILNYIGIDTAQGIDLTYLDYESGEERQMTLPVVHWQSKPEWSVISAQKYCTNTGENWFEIDEENGILYFAYNACSADAETEDAILQVIKALEKDPDLTLFIDFRNNGGGNSTILQPLIDYIYYNYYGNYLGRSVYAGISGKSMSSAPMNVHVLQRTGKVTVIGEPTGEYYLDIGEQLSFELPNSGLTCRYSTKIFGAENTYTKGMDNARMPVLDYDKTAIEPDVLLVNTIDCIADDRDILYEYVTDMRESVLQGTTKASLF